MARVGVTCQGPRYGLSYIRKTHRLLSMLFRTFSHFFMLFIRKVEKAMSSTCQNAFRVAQKSRWPFKSKESIVAWKSTCILTKVKQKNIKYSSNSTELVSPLPCVVVGGVHHCLLSVVVCPSPCVTVGPQWWSSITVVVGGPRWWLSITIRSHWWSSSLCIIVRCNPSPSPSPSIAIAVTISRQSLLSIVSRRHHRLSLSVVIVGLRRWSSSLVVSHRHCGCSRLVVGCRHWLSVVSHHHCGCRSWS